MTDWTRPEDVPETTVEHLHRWLRSGNPEDAATAGERAVADVIRAFWPAPAPTLAEELRDIAASLRTSTSVHNDRHMTDDSRNWLTDLARRIDTQSSRAGQVEKDRDEARAAAKTWQEQNENDCEMYSEDIADTLVTLAETRAEVERWKKAEREASVERDDAEAEVEQLRAARERLNAEVERLTAHIVAHGGQSMPAGDIPGTALPIHRTRRSKSKETLSSSTPDPADVKPGEAWIVEFEGHSTIGKRGTVDEEVPWALLGGRWVSDSAITLVSRLVPAPRVITDPDELEQLAATSIIRDGRGWPGGVTDQGVTMINGACLSDEEVLSHGPVTVLWEAES